MTMDDGIAGVLEDLARNQMARLQSSGVIRPTSGLTKPAPSPRDFDTPLGYYDHMHDQMRQERRVDPFKFNDQSAQRYRDRRFEFLAAEEGYRSKTYEDINGFRTVGYGFNMDAQTNRQVFEQVLGRDKWADVYSGRRELNKVEARRLFDATAEQAEQIVETKFRDVPLREHQRLALVSLAFNNPALIGPNLTRQVKSGDWKAATEEILYRSNRTKHRGLASRRYREASLFSGVLDSGVPPYEQYIAQYT